MKTICEKCELVKLYQELAKGKEDVIKIQEKRINVLERNLQLKFDFNMN